MRATILNCTVKPSPEPSNTDALAELVAAGLRELGADVRTIRLVDHDIKSGVSSDMGDGDEWPGIREEIVNSEILIMASPTWVGHPSSVAQRAIERMDAMLSETGDDGTPVAYNRVAGVVVTGNEDGAHHVISENNGALGDIGFRIPGQAWVNWNMGPGPGPSYSDTDHGHQYVHQVAGLMAKNLYALAAALRDRPIPAEISRGED
ncbi:flavodoxin family protein [Amycolatopsis methanolica]|uniref:NADPH-dependent FMN reductase-like domain-containing protein n=1 Tax=Amycolatopsis methanolica 239 TaxID=1068978 RepID=A0A076N3J0_AMYME|nr:flavodoxin family protein [Amycolatopsis methanolica]AIJ25786.1 hypothetical protein AMETH_5694 [Amycolatopsis methanolica 239]